MVLRRRAMMKKVANRPAVVVPITWSGSGADKTSSIIDATNGAVYFSLPFISGDSRLVSTATAESEGIKWRKAALYSDVNATTLVGYYDHVSNTVVSTRGTTVNSPFLHFNTEVKMAPKGYYVQLMLSRSGSAAFSSNANLGTYLNAYGTQATLK